MDTTTEPTLDLTLTQSPSDAEKRYRNGAIRTLLAAWRDAASETRVEYRHALSNGFDQIRVNSTTKHREGEFFPPLPASKCLALAVLLDEDERAAAALADYMVELGVEAFAAERQRVKERYDRVEFDLIYGGYGYGDGRDSVSKWASEFKRRFFDEDSQ